jgi:uncharacterized ferritin-like protein (DUF455 family)
MTSFLQPELFNWKPYLIGTPIKIRPIGTEEGLGDRIRLVAFAERQAHYAFLLACKLFEQDAPKELISAWKRIAIEEAKHESWLLKRLKEINQDVDAFPVSLALFQSFSKCKTAREFTLYISDSEERGRVAAVKFAEFLEKNDPETAKIFANIAIEEVAHISLAQEFFS